MQTLAASWSVCWADWQTQLEHQQQEQQRALQALHVLESALKVRLHMRDYVCAITGVYE
jgi:hypothetical protein